MKQFSVAQTLHCNVRTTLLCLIVVLALVISPTVHAGKLSDTRHAVRDRSSSSNGGSSDNNDDDDYDSDGSVDSDAVLACLIPFVLPFCIIAAAVKDKDNEDSKPVERALFRPYPYANGGDGRLVIESEETAVPPVYAESATEGAELVVEAEESEEAGEVLIFSETGAPRDTSYARVGGKVAASYIYDWDGVHVPGGVLMVDSSVRIGFETEWQLYLEPLEDTVDQFWMGRINMNVRFAQSSFFEGRFGLGGRMMIVDGVSGGFDSGLSFQFFPIKPLNIAADLHLGNLGRAFYLEGRAAFGVNLNRAELFAGYRASLVQGRDISVVFHGPVAGVSVWF